MKLLFFGLAVLAGLSNPLQSAANAALNKTLGNPVAAAACIYAVSLTTLALVVGVAAAVWGVPVRASLAKAGDVQWWGWIGGAGGVVFVFAGALATKQIGAGPFTVTTLVTAVVLSIALDHFGLLGLEQHAATWPRLLGGALAICGVFLVGRF